MSQKSLNALFAAFVGLVVMLIVWPWGGQAGGLRTPETASQETSGFLRLNLTTSYAATPTPKGRGIFNPQGLENFFVALAQSHKQPVRVVHYGDSHTAADLWTGFLRERLQTAFGDGGPGYLTPANPFSGTRRNALSAADDGWIFDGIGRQAGARDGFYGLAGVSLSAEHADAALTLTSNANRYEIYYLKRPNGGRFALRTGGREVTKEPVSTAADVPQAGYEAFTLNGKGNHVMELRTLDDKPVRILGIVAERPTGLVYDALGINGARLKRWQDWSKTLLADNLRRRQPALVILAYGTNEVTDDDWTPENYTRLLAAVVRQVQQAAPDASILIVGPPERADKSLATERLPALIAAQKQAAAETGVAFWSAYDATGGAGMMATWVAAKWAQPDRVHLSRLGYQQLGALLYEDLRVAFEQLRTASRKPFPAE